MGLAADIAPPTGVTATTDLPHRVDITWNADPRADQGYLVYRNGTNSPCTYATLIADLPDTESTFFEDVPQLPNVNYRYSIRGRRDGHVSACSEQVIGKFTAPPLLPPQLNSVSTRVPDRIDLSWSPAEGADWYFVYRSKLNQACPVRGQIVSTNPQTAPPEGTYYLDRSVAPNVTYYYSLRSFNSRTHKLSPCSNVKSGFSEQRRATRSDPSHRRRMSSKL